MGKEAVVEAVAHPAHGSAARCFCLPQFGGFSDERMTNDMMRIKRQRDQESVVK